MCVYNIKTKMENNTVRDVLNKGKPWMCSQQREAMDVFSTKGSHGCVLNKGKPWMCSQQREAMDVFSTKGSHGCVLNKGKLRLCSQ